MAARDDGAIEAGQIAQETVTKSMDELKEAWAATERVRDRRPRRRRHHPNDRHDLQIGERLDGVKGSGQVAKGCPPLTR